MACRRMKKLPFRDDRLRAVEFVRGESCPAQYVLPPVGLAADKFTRDQCKVPLAIRVLLNS